MTLRTLPKALSATNTERARSAEGPNILRKKDAARIRPDETISALGTAAKYAIFASMYSTETSARADGAAILRILTGFFASASA